MKRGINFMVRIGNGDPLKCSFCGKGQLQIKKLIAGPGVYICDECVDLCDEIIKEELADDVKLDELPKPRPVMNSQTMALGYLIDGEERDDPATMLWTAPIDNSHVSLLEIPEMGYVIVQHEEPLTSKFHPSASAPGT